MRLRSLLLGCGFLVGMAAGCDVPRPSPVPSTNAVKSATIPVAPRGDTNAPHFHLDHAQPKLATVKLWIGSKEIDAEMCLTLSQVATGLMFRPGITNDESMLFVFPKPQQLAFYMKNVGFDIDAAYIDGGGVIQQIVRLKKMDETPVPSASNEIQFVLETAPGWFERNGIGVGALVKTPRRSLREEFGLN